MVKVLNLIHLLLVLCLDQPIVINAIAILIEDALMMLSVVPYQPFDRMMQNSKVIQNIKSTNN
jgi:hypothetical protein